MTARASTAGRGTNAKGVTLVLSQVLPVMAVVSLFPAIPRLAAQFASDADAALLVPMIVTLPSLLVALVSPFAGIVADRFGRRTTFVGGLALYCLSGLAPTVLDSLRAIVASRALLGVAEATIFTVSSALIGDYFGEQRHRWVAWVGVASSVFGTLLIIAGGVLADLSWRGPFALYGFALPIFLLALFVIDEPAEMAQAERVEAGYPWREALIIGSVTLVSAVCYYVEPLHIAAVLLEKGAGSATRVGLIQGLTSIAYIGGSLAYRGLYRRTIGEQLALAGLLVGAGTALIALAPDDRWVAAAALVQQFGAGMVIPSLLAWGQARLPLAQRGRGMGIWATAFFSGLFLCPPLVTLIGTHAGGLQPALLVLGLVTLALSVLPPLLFGRRRATVAAAI